MKYEFSIIIPVYNRPTEIHELLNSCLQVKDINACEIVIVEDGSDITCESILKDFKNRLNISYYFKPNSGPGDSRNFGMNKAKAKYYIILDSDVLLPINYIINIKNNLQSQYVDCFGGPDRAHDSFSTVQKSINYAMTSFWTTGGVRGRDSQKKNFQPRSFNMGLSKNAFIKSGGFSNIHPGEDPDLSLRLQKLGFKTALFLDCFVYHKRRVDWRLFTKQIYKFGLVRPILNSWHPESYKLIYFMPSCFGLGFVLALVLFALGFPWLLLVYIIYYIFVFIDALIHNKNIKIAWFSLWAVSIQLFSYGFAFLKSSILFSVLKRNPKLTFPFLFYKN